MRCARKRVAKKSNVNKKHCLGMFVEFCVKYTFKQVKKNGSGSVLGTLFRQYDFTTCTLDLINLSYNYV